MKICDLLSKLRDFREAQLHQSTRGGGPSASLDGNQGIRLAETAAIDEAALCRCLRQALKEELHDWFSKLLSRPFALRGLTGLRSTQITFATIPFQFMPADPMRRAFTIGGPYGGTSIWPFPDLIDANQGFFMGQPNGVQWLTEETHGVLVKYPWWSYGPVDVVPHFNLLEEYYLPGTQRPLI